MAALDLYPVTIRGPLTTNSSRLSTFARIFTHEGRFYVAESRTKGRTVVSVSSYEMPEGEPMRRGGTKAGRWGEWSWSGCGCANSWRSQNIAELVAMDQTVYGDPEPEPEPEPDETVTAPPVTGSNPYDWPDDTTDLI